MTVSARRPDCCVSIAPVLVPCARSGSRAVDLRAVRDGTIDGVPIPTGALLAMHGAGLSLLHPPSPLRIGPCVFRGGTTIEFHRAPVVASGTLAEPVELDGVPCAADVPLTLDHRGHVEEATLHRDLRVEGFLAAAGTRIAFTEGLLRTFEPAQETVVDGVPCAARHPVHLARRRAAAPTLYTATLARDQTLCGVPCAGGRVVTMHEGKLQVAWLARAWEVGGLRLRAGTCVAGALPEVVTSGTLDAAAVVDGVPCAAGAEIGRDTRGVLTRFTLARDHVVDGVACLAGYAIRSRHDPEGYRYVLAAPCRKRGVRWRRGDVLWLDADETTRALLGSPRRLGGVDLPTGSEVGVLGRFFHTYEVKLGATIEANGRHLSAGTWATIRGGRLCPSTDDACGAP